jgi:pantoate--beta-alanine ligase
MSSNVNVINSISEMKDYIRSIPKISSVGFIPTMGALHDGHLSLIEQSIKDNDNTIVSIFVNPHQFGNNEDYAIYPRNIDNDLELLSHYNIEAVFIPLENEMYPSGFSTWVTVEKLGDILCGKSRPGHFVGVVTIVCKLINLIKPNYLYLGEKDYQQLFILEKVIEELNYTTQIKRCETIRDSDGLAKSSRNLYLSKEERVSALSIYQSLMMAKQLVEDQVYDVEIIKAKMRKLIIEAGGDVDYIEFINEYTLELENDVSPTSRLLIAVKFGKIRLIDNIKIYS